jgi:hypothetical protein
MGKRFTATEKWMDPWFRSLPLGQKLGWNYLCDNCDAAGVIDLDRGLADFFIGETVDWEGLIKASGDRIVIIKKGKLWLTGFIQFQYGTLSENCHPHKAVFKILAKHRILEAYQKGTSTLQEKDKEQDKEKDKDSEGGSGGKPKRFTPPSVDDVAAYCRERKNHVDPQQFVDFYSGKGWKVGKNSMVDWKACVRTWEKNGVEIRAGPADPRGVKSAVAEFILRGKTDGES